MDRYQFSEVASKCGQLTVSGVDSHKTEFTNTHHTPNYVSG